jgi:hypothetical protein
MPWQAVHFCLKIAAPAAASCALAELAAAKLRKEISISDFVTLLKNNEMILILSIYA